MTFNEFSSPAPLTLESVKIQFDHWRSIRARGSKTPKHLWEAIQGLAKMYDYEQIASTLNINPRRLRAKLQKPPYQCSDSLKTDFVEVPLLSLTSSSSHSPPSGPKTFNSDGYARSTIEFTRPDGLALKASGLNHSDLFSLVKSFLSQ